MPDLEPNDKSEFMIERIKERPVNKKKLIKRTLVTVAMAVIFGLVACFTFLVLEPVISNLLYPEEEPQIVVFPEDQEEMSPEEMLSDNMQMENQLQTESQSQETPEAPALAEEQIQQVLSRIVLNKDNYRQLYNAMWEYTEELSKYMVTITGVTSDIDWFHTVQERSNQASGVIIANNGQELLILADYTPIQEAESLTVTFYNNVQVEASLKDIDINTNLAVLNVDLILLPKEMLENNLMIATLGSSNIKNIVGIPVIALGHPMGTKGSMGYGMITSVSSQTTITDINYKIMTTDIVGSQKAGGVLFNFQGQVVGMITGNSSNPDMENMISAYGITELKKKIEKMSNGQKMAYLGIKGMDVTKEAHEEIGVPYGAYVKEVDMDSPAMLAGILQGDVVVSLDKKNVLTFGEYTTILMQLEAESEVELKIMRQVQDEYKEMEFKVILGEAQ